MLLHLGQISQSTQDGQLNLTQYFEQYLQALIAATSDYNGSSQYFSIERAAIQTLNLASGRIVGGLFENELLQTKLLTPYKCNTGNSLCDAHLLLVEAVLDIALVILRDQECDPALQTAAVEMQKIVRSYDAIKGADFAHELEQATLKLSGETRALLNMFAHLCLTLRKYDAILSDQAVINNSTHTHRSAVTQMLCLFSAAACVSTACFGACCCCCEACCCCCCEACCCCDAFCCKACCCCEACFGACCCCEAFFCCKACSCCYCCCCKACCTACCEAS